MNATDLRQVAAEIREKANAFITEWSDPPRVDIDREGTCDNCAQHKHLVASYPDADSEPWLCAPCAAHADHEAAWVRQPVALAVADWLDESARGMDNIAGGLGISVSIGDQTGVARFVHAWRGES